MRAALALLTNAAVWGLSWIPFKSLDQQGLHPLWSTALIYLGSTGVMIYLCRHSLLSAMGRPALWGLAAAAGLTNACFNTAVAMGDVVRVILLFYLMPVWAVCLARLILREPLSSLNIARIGIGLAGAMVILGAGGNAAATGPIGLALPASLSDWLAVAGGFLFALNNVTLRKLHDIPGRWGTLAMVSGACLMSTGLAASLTALGTLPPPSATASAVAPTLLLWSILFMAANACLQYGASRLPATVTAVLMLSEIVFGSVSAWALGSATIGMREWVGGALILMAAVLPHHQSGDTQQTPSEKLL